MAVSCPFSCFHMLTLKLLSVTDEKYMDFSPAVIERLELLSAVRGVPIPDHCAIDLLKGLKTRNRQRDKKRGFIEEAGVIIPTKIEMDKGNTHTSLV